jgi:hypothetical protein
LEFCRRYVALISALTTPRYLREEVWNPYLAVKEGQSSGIAQLQIPAKFSDGDTPSA